MRQLALKKYLPGEIVLNEKRGVRVLTRMKDIVGEAGERVVDTERNGEGTF